ncbi:hypothetical protein ACIBO1_29270 [Micromonospora sp. NPDC049903]|uniref:hypothetical protein n=1 Tax=Micromonospora sp. NPDC049903 TaxID=3364276 RepID=UPI00379307BA
MSRTISKKHLLAGLAAAGVLGVGIAAPTVALADDKATPSASASAEQQDEKRPEPGAHRTQFAEALAEELGVPTEKVTEALEKLREQRKQDRPDGEGRERPDGDRGPKGSAEDRKEALAERLAKAVEDGKLTQEQADAITSAVEAGVFGGPGGWAGRGGPGGTAGK